MDKISFDEFYSTYGVRRNPIESICNYENTMLDSNDDEIDLIEEEEPTKVWTLTENKDIGFVLNPGIIYKKNVVGYFLCKNEWKNKQVSYILL